MCLRTLSGGQSFVLRPGVNLELRALNGPPFSASNPFRPERYCILHQPRQGGAGCPVDGVPRALHQVCRQSDGDALPRYICRFRIILDQDRRG